MDTNIIRGDAEIQNFLQSKIEAGGIAAEVAKEAIAHSYDDMQDFLYDLTIYGCVSGMIGSLTYYVDTHDFFEEHYDEIEELREEWMEQT